MENVLYLVCTVIEYSDSVTVGNALYRNYEDAKKAMAQEIDDARENFTDLETLSDMACYYEARDEVQPELNMKHSVILFFKY